ncbi:MAG: HEAT repeat domain-containing protein [Calditrichaeota bacterium]|nr:HEAT repeat domain-containing protein [Calditrichota bacterium]
MRILIYLLVVAAVFAQKEVTLISDLNDYKKISDREFSISWEIPVYTDGNNHFGHFSSDDYQRNLSDLISNKNHTVLTIVFEKSSKEISSWSASGSDAIRFRRSFPLYWAGLIPVNQSYDFVKSLIKDKYDKEDIYGLLVAHDKHEETLAYFKDELKSANSNRLREKLIFWTGNIGSEKAVDFLIELFNNENYFNLREKMIFALHISNVDKAYQYIKKLVVSEDSPYDVRSKALFWYGQSEQTSLADIVKLMKELESDEMKEKCIFAISQKNNDESAKYLYDFAVSDEPLQLREKAVFWLANSQKNSLDYLKKLYIRTTDNRLQEKLIFAFHQNGSDEAIDFMVKLLKSDITPTRVKKKIIFWLGQSKSEKAMGAISGLLD